MKKGGVKRDRGYQKTSKSFGRYERGEANRASQGLFLRGRTGDWGD